MVKAQGSIIINRSIDDVFAFVSNGANGTAWLAALESARSEPDGPTQVGTRIYEERLYGRQRIHQVAEVVEVADYRFRKRVVGGPMDVEDHVVCRPVDGAAHTEVTQYLTATPKGVVVLATPFLAPQLRRDIKRSLEQLKRVLESGNHG
ncbi:MAG TPA: SRPBCC family protein [Ktedonobacterales bacterium]|nr:SRPBCC family protein [Ktedonobacterales bacterium]